MVSLGIYSIKDCSFYFKVISECNQILSVELTVFYSVIFFFTFLLYSYFLPLPYSAVSKIWN